MNVKLVLNQYWDIMFSKPCIYCKNVSYKTLLTTIVFEKWNLDTRTSFMQGFLLFPLHLNNEMIFTFGNCM